MSDTETTTEEVAAGVPTPALLRAARGTYGVGIRREFRDAGIGGMPPEGAHIVGGMGNHGVAIADLTRQLGSASRGERIVAALVENGFLERDGADYQLTDKGRRAAAAVRDGVSTVEEKLRAQLTAEQYEGFRRGLVALCDIREGWEHEPSPDE